MEIVASLPSGTPGANSGVKKHIEEWSRLDRLTGMLETARVEADHWAKNTSNSRHRYGKVVDSRARNLADGSVQQQQQTKQLEVYQAHIPGGSVQVIRSHTSTTSSWRNSKILKSDMCSDWPSNFMDKFHHNNIMESTVNNFQKLHNFVNLETEKTKASMARSMPPRRPPTRTKSLLKSTNEENSSASPPETNVPEKQPETISTELKPSPSETQSPKPLTNGTSNDFDCSHSKLEKKKSISDENLNISNEKENSNPWKRDSKERWSLQYLRSKFKDDELELEKKSQLEKVLEKAIKRNGEIIEKYVDPVDGFAKTPSQPSKRMSFVTEESLRETKLKLRHLDNAERKVEIYLDVNEEEEDDGICNESKNNSDREEEHSHRCVENEKKTNSDSSGLENCGKVKSDDWFNRRKSYGFEPVCGPRDNLAVKCAPNSNLSTDSGICRSSELELASTSIVKKLTDLSLEKSTTVSDLLHKFEKKTETQTTVVAVNEEKSIVESEEKTIRSGKVAELLKTLRESSLNPTAFEVKSNKNSEVFVESKNANCEVKEHPIGRDVCKLSFPEDFAEKLSSSDSPKMVINVNNFERGDVASPNTMISSGDASDVKKPKKVEFSKTEVHFAAAEPGKIKIVETDEKPRPHNLHRRKRRSTSMSPKMNLSQTKFGDKLFEEYKRERSKVVVDEPYHGAEFASSVSDNGLAVRISSAKCSEGRQSSWPASEANENKAGYSTKVNLDGEGMTVVEDASFRPKYDQFRSSEESPFHKSGAEDKDVYANIDKNGINVQERMIVHIGGGGCGIAAVDKYPKNRLKNNFCNSPATTSSPPNNCSSRSNGFKSTSLIIDTIKNSLESISQHSKYESDNLDKDEAEQQPSTYLTEMNKLQQKYRIQKNKSVEKLTMKDEKIKSLRIYNTVPGAKNDLTRSKILSNDLPSMLSAFDKLYQSIDKAIDENRSCKGYTNTKTTCEKKITQQYSSKVEKYSSRSWLLQQIVAQKDGNISDDSLKADEEVRSYMSTAAMEEYENELSGSWSRRRYLKHVKPNSVVVKEDEISEKSHFKPLLTEEEKLKTVTNFTNVDIKKPKITSVAVNLTPQILTWPESDENGNLKKSTTVLLNSNELVKNEPVIMSEAQGACPKEDKFENTPKDRTQSKSEMKSGIEFKSVKVIHHSGVQLPEKRIFSEVEKSKGISSVRIRKPTADNASTSNGSISRRAPHEREKLWDSGRDSWLNLPKDRKAAAERSVHSNGSVRMKSTRTRKLVEEKETQSRKSQWSGYANTSSEDDAVKRSQGNKHQFTKPTMSTISEKVNVRAENNSFKVNSSAHKAPVTKTTSNSSLESRSNSFEFHTPALKTEERSKRRAARLLQRASNREAMISMKSSSEDITSENEVNCYTNEKKNLHNTRIPKTKLEQAKLLSKPNVNRLIQQKSARMKINIFDIKERSEHNRKMTSQSRSSRGHLTAPYESMTSSVSKTRCQPSGQTDVNTRFAQKAKNTPRIITSNNKKHAITSTPNKIT